MSHPLFKHPKINSRYERRRSDFITPLSKPKRREKSAEQQQGFVFDERNGMSTQTQQYDPIRSMNWDWFHPGIKNAARLAIALNVSSAQVMKGADE